MAKFIKVGFVFSIEVSKYKSCLKVSMTLLRKQNEHMTSIYSTHEWENQPDGQRAFKELSIYSQWLIGELSH